MTDITPDFSICLKEKGAQPILRQEYSLDKIDTFLQDAYSIVRSTATDGKRKRSRSLRMPVLCLSLKSFALSARAISPPPLLSADVMQMDRTEHGP